jgi:archaellum component FlaG (FlaF/FlaG flagellin family)
MIEIKKKNCFVAFIIVILIASSTVSVISNQNISIKKSTYKDERIDFLGTSASEIQALNIDVKVQKNQGINVENKVNANAIIFSIFSLIYEKFFNNDGVIVFIEPNENSPPIANDDYASVDEDSSDNMIDVLSNDSDPDPGDTITLDSIEVEPLNGTAVIVDDMVSYTPNENFAGDDSFIYNISDSYGETDTAEVLITILNINDPPVAVDDEFSTYENTPADFDVIANDYDIDGDEITLYSIDIPPSNGEATIISGKIRYEPENDFFGFDSLIYNITDGNGAYDTAVLLINVIEVIENKLPVAEDDNYTVYKNSSENIFYVLANDTDPDGDTINIDSIVSEPVYGTVNIDTIQNIILYTPNIGFVGIDCFEYNITDGRGGNDTAKVTVNVVLNASDIIVKPKKEYLYFRNQELSQITGLLQFIDADTVVIGPITVKLEIDDPDFELEKVDFYIDNILKNTTSETPYEWTFNKILIRIITIKVVAYGNVLGKDCTISDEIDALIFNLGLFSKGNVINNSN